MRIEDLRIGQTVIETNGYWAEMPLMEVVGIFKDGSVYLDFDGNEGNVWEVEAKDLKPKEETTKEGVWVNGFFYNAVKSEKIFACKEACALYRHCEIGKMPCLAFGRDYLFEIKKR